MNKHVHRLVFDRRRGMCVPAAETARSAGKSASGQCRARGGASGLGGAAAVVLAACAWDPCGAHAAGGMPLSTLIPRSAAVMADKAAAGRPMANLPQRFRDFSGKTPGNPVDVNRFRIDTTDPRTMRIDQFDDRVIINWDTFDIGPGYTVRFVQPTGGSALNNIWDNQASVILGRIQANGEVLLQNQNGILFGPTARVDTQRFVATALKLADETFLKGIRSAQGGSTPTFGGTDQQDQGFVSVERGAEIKALAGGDVILVAPRVYNEGRIETPSGQTVMAAGQKVYLFSSTDAAQRGLWVTVDAFDPMVTPTRAGVNTVEQAATGTYTVRDGETVSNETGTTGLEQRINEVVADKGRINLVGMVVRQMGKLSATTAVKGQNGAILLHAVQSTTASADNVVNGNLGQLEIGAGSVTRVTPSEESATQKDAETFYRSTIELFGKDIRIGAGALVEAVSGNLSIMAAATQQNPLFNGEGTATQDASLFIDRDVRLSVAGLRDVALPMSRNQLMLNLYQNELADTPVQRGGVLYRNQVYFDARKPVAVANVKGAYNLIERTARELSVRGGNLRVEADGALVVADGVKLDVSGGSKRYDAGQLLTSVLGRGAGTSVSLDQARPDVRYDRLISPGQLSGEAAPSSLASTATQPRETSYVEGADAGWLSLKGSTLYIGAEIQAGAVVGPLQLWGNPSGTTVSAADTTVRLNTKVSTELGRLATLIDKPHLYAAVRPLGGRVDIENTQGSVRLQADTAGAMPTLPDEDGGAASNWLAGLATETRVSATMLQNSGASAVALKATHTSDTVPHDVNVDADVRLDLGASGSFLAASQGGGTVTMAGQVRAAGGTIALEAGQARASGTGEGNAIGAGPGNVIVASTAVLDVSGGASARGAEADGGQIAIKAGHSVSVAGGALLNVSAALLRGAPSGTVKGEAGGINLQVNTAVPAGVPEDTVSGKLILAGTLRGFDFNRGGKLAIGGLRSLWIGEPTAQVPQALQSGLQIAPTFFSEGGFGTFTLQTKGDIVVADHTRIVPRLVNLSEPVNSSQINVGRAGPTGTAMAAETERVVLDDALRQPVSITLDASALKADVAMSIQPTGLNRGGSVTLGVGAVMDAGLGGSLTLRGSYRVDVHGALLARGGDVTVGLGTDTVLHRVGSSPTNALELDPVGYLPDQAVQLHDTSLIDVSGAARVRATTVAGQTRLVGDVLGGGTVSLNPDAQRGWVLMDEGAVINLSGAQAALHTGVSRQATTVSAAAGTLNVSSLYGFYLGGTLIAHRPDASVSGGQFNARSVAGSIRDFQLQPDTVPGTAFPVTALSEVGRIRVVGEGQAVSTDAAARTFGESQVSASGLLDSGFDRLSFTASERVVLGRDANLVARPADRAGHVPLRSVVLDAPVIAAEASASGTPNAVTVQAHHVSIGSARSADPALGMQPPGAATTGTAALTVNAGLIDWYGTHAFQGFANVALRATLSAKHEVGARRNGEIRLNGLGAGTTRPTAALLFDGHLELQAGNLYASTLTDARIEGTATSTLQTLNPEKGSSSASPLSALGRLTLDAGTVSHAGTIDQPFGDIRITGTQVALQDGSRLSVSGEGLVVPVGFMLNGQRWLYGTSEAGVASSADAKAVLDLVDLHKDVTVESPNLTVASSSRIQAQAGGDLLAWEFVEGVGGTKDTFNRAGVYAIVPSHTYEFAPYDTQTALTAAANGQPLSVGAQVRITSANGALPPGTYTLLPARYGILPGAVLVSARTLASDQPLATGLTRPDGSVLVSGVETAVGTDINGGNRRNLALLLEPAATAAAQSRVDRVSINDFLSTQEGTRPATGGRVSLLSTQAFDWTASYQLKGGELDLSMGRSLVVGLAGTTRLEEGEVLVSAEALSRTEADSILLGGQREEVKGETVVTAKAEHIRFDGDVSTGELIAVAQRGIDVAQGVSLTVDEDKHADTDVQRVVRVQGDGATLAVSHNKGLDVQRDLASVAPGTPLAGQLSIASSPAAPSALKAAHVVMDAAGALSVNPDTAIQARAMSVAAGQIAIGDTTADSALVLAGGLLESVNAAERVQLRSYGAMQFAANASLGSVKTAQLTLDAPALVGQGGDITVRAGEVVLRNTTGRAAPTDLTGAGRLRIEANPALSDVRTGGLIVGVGPVRLAAESVTLASQGDLVFDGRGKQTNTLSSQGDLTLSAARVTALSGGAHQARADGVLRVEKAAGSRTLGETAGLGATLALSGTRVEQQGRVEVASGKLEIEGRGATDSARTVVLGEGSVTRAAGTVVQAGRTWAASSAGGEVRIRAASGDIEVLGQIDVSAGGVPVYDGTGKVVGWKTASASDSAKAAGTIELSAPTESGRVVFGAEASLLGRASTDTLSGQLVVDAGRVAEAAQASAAAGVRGTLDRLAELSNEGGLHGAVTVRLRGTEDQSLHTAMKAVRTRISVDQRSLTLGRDALIDARAPQGGMVQLAARGLTLEDGARIEAASSRDGAQGGDVLLSATTGVRIVTTVDADTGETTVSTESDPGVLDLRAGATVDAGTGRIVLRAERDDNELAAAMALAADAAAQAADGRDPVLDAAALARGLRMAPVQATLNAREVLVESARVYERNDDGEAYTGIRTAASSGTLLGQRDLATHAAEFLAARDVLMGSLGLLGRAQLRAGVEVRTTGDFTVSNDWNLWRADRADDPTLAPLMLTLRAGGHLRVNGTLSDGFTTAAATGSVAPGDAASFRLTAGADLSASDLLAVQQTAAEADLTVAAGKVVRTTTGSIEMAAARDVVLAPGSGTNPVQGLVYVAGRPVELQADQVAAAPDVNALSYTERGGRLEVHAGRDVRSAAPVQLPSNWLLHAGVMADDGSVGLGAWASYLAGFRQGLGSFGGGNVHVSAGRDILDLGVVAPTSARHVQTWTTNTDGDAVLGTPALDVRNGGDVTVQAAGDIRGGVYLLGRGEGRLEAGGALTTGSNVKADVPAQGAILALMDGHWSLQARTGLEIAAVYNPTALSSPSTTRVPAESAASFFTYGSDSGVRLSSAAGDVVWNAEGAFSSFETLVGTPTRPTTVQGYFNYLHGSGQLMPAADRVTRALAVSNRLAQVAPPTVQVSALDGAVKLLTSELYALWLFPSATGNLSVYAGHDLSIQGGSRGVVMLDGDPGRWPSVSRPALETGWTDGVYATLRPAELGLAGENRKLSVDTLYSSTLHQNDALPATLYAGGSITTDTRLTVPKAAVVEAGGDIMDLSFAGQHFHETDVTLIKAGGRIVGRDNTLSDRDSGMIQLAGPGELQVEAGTDLDLRTAGGIQTIGNLPGSYYGISAFNVGNAALPDTGASVRVSAGMNRRVDVDTLMQRYLAQDPQAQVALVNHVRGVLALPASQMPDLSGLVGAELQTALASAFPAALQYYRQFSQAHQLSFAEAVVDRAFVARYVAPGQAYAVAWAARASALGLDPARTEGTAFQQFKDEVLIGEVRRLGQQAVELADSTDPAENQRRQAQRNALWAQVDEVTSLAGLGAGFHFDGDINLASSKIHTLANGNLLSGGADLFAPGGQILVGYSSSTPTDRDNAATRGLVAYNGGSIRALADADFQVNTQKAFVVGEGDLVLYSRRGAIDSGRGSNTDVTVPAPVPVVDPLTGAVVFRSPAVTTGSGIGLLKKADGTSRGTVDLFAPIGGVLALDTFIRNESGGDIRVAGPVKGGDNLKGNVKGGAPTVSRPSVKVGTKMPGEVTSGATQMAEASQAARRKEANGILTVELLSLGDDSVTRSGAPQAGPASPCPPNERDCAR